MKKFIRNEIQEKVDEIKVFDVKVTEKDISIADI